MGLTFPLLLARIAQRPNVGELVGKLTSVNTLGAVVGSLVTGYLVLPYLGSQRSLLAIAIVYALAAVATELRRPTLRPVLWVTAAAVATALLAPRWDLMRLTSGTNVYFEGHEVPDEILTLREDIHGGVTSVVRHGNVKTLLTNGKFQGNTGWEMDAQRFFAHYPSLFVNRFDRALVIGLGTGTTLGTLAAYPWQKLDVVEISPSIVKAARAHFGRSNGGALDDPRVRLHIDDGRNFLLIDRGRYDLISMELSSIWFAGAASLYSREYYGLVREHLSKRGIFQQWVQLHHIYPRDFATALNTLRQQFRHVAVFYGGGQGILVASDAPLRAPVAKLSQLEQLPDIAEVIPKGRPLASLVQDILLLDAGVDRYLQGIARRSGARLEELISTDDNLYLEYATPKGNVLDWAERNRIVAEMGRHRDAAAIARLLVENGASRLASHEEKQENSGL
jgi:spermidine synthase